MSRLAKFRHVDGPMHNSPHRKTKPEGEIERAQQLRRQAQNTITTLKRLWVDFLVKELELGIAFSQYAEDSWSQGRKQDCFSKKWIARQAHLTFLRLFSHASLTVHQRALMDLKLNELEARLKALDRYQTV